MYTNKNSNLLPVPFDLLQIASLPQALLSSDNNKRASFTAPVRFSLIVPTYNESGNIDKIVRILCRILDQSMPDDYELIIVDDNSPDRTWELAQELASDYPHLRVMRREHERGLATAVIRGWQVARGEVLGVIDGDLQHPPEVLLQLLDAIESGADLAVASRHVEGGGVSDWSLTRRILSRGAQTFGLIVLPRVISRVSDPMSGYFMVRRSAIAGHSLNPAGYKILIEVLGRGEIEQIAEVGYVFQEREEGKSKVTWKQYKDYLHHLLRLRLSSGRISRLRRKLNFPIGRFLMFGLVGLSGVAVNMGVFHILFGMLGMALTRSVILSASAAIVNNFIWNDLWTFGDIARQQRQWRKTINRFVKFAVVCLMGLILNVLLLNLLFNLFHINPYLANLLAIATVTVWNFWINLKLNWRTTETK